MKKFYEPTQEQLTKLDSEWICSYSGGKDSTSLVTWLEWMRREGWLPTKVRPRLVISDTGVEFPFLREIALELMGLLVKSGWTCEEVAPLIQDKLYCQIFGRGITPIHPGIRNMRWCTRSTKIKPMDTFKKTLPEGTLQITGVRWGESKTRDAKLLKAGCRAGGECGLPGLDGDNKYAPVIDWTDCQVFDWLHGLVAVDGMDDVFAITKKLMGIYKAEKTKHGFDFAPEKVKLLRFGCIGCPAITGTHSYCRIQEQDNPRLRHLRKLYGLWDQLREPSSRLYKERPSKREKTKGKLKGVYGPLKMSVRRTAFEQLLRIQEQSGVTLVTEEDVTFIKECWEKGVYPRGWSAEDEW